MKKMSWFTKALIGFAAFFICIREPLIPLILVVVALLGAASVGVYTLYKIAEKDGE